MFDTPNQPPKPGAVEDIFANGSGPKMPPAPPSSPPGPRPPAPRPPQSPVGMPQAPIGVPPTSPRLETKSGIRPKPLVFVAILIVILILVGVAIWFFFLRAPAEPVAELTPIDTNMEDITPTSDVPVFEPVVTPEEEELFSEDEDALGEPVLEPEPEMPSVDSDGDGLTDEEEMVLGTAINNTDTDGDGLFDKQEVVTYGTDPLNEDTDGDGFSDGSEVQNGYNPNGSGRLFQVPLQ